MKLTRGLVVAMPLAVLLAPVVGAEPITTNVRFEESVRLTGSQEVLATAGALDLAPDLTRSARVSIAWSSIDGEIVTERAPESVSMTPFREVERESVSGGPGSLDVLACRSRCVFLVTADGAGQLRATGQGSRSIGHPAQRDYMGQDDRLPWSTGMWAGNSYRVWRSWYAFPLEPGGSEDGNATFVAQGDLTLLVFDADLKIFTRETARSVHTGDTSEGGFLSIRSSQTRIQRYAVFHLHGAHVEAERSSAALFAPSLTFHHDGVLHAPRAWGDVVVGRSHLQLSGEPLTLEGQLRGTLTTINLRKPTSVVWDPNAFSSLATVDGNAATMGPSAPGPVPSLAARSVIVTLFAAAITGFYGAAHLFPLYSRLTGRDALDSAARRNLHQLVRASPGVTLQQLSDECALSYSLVRHHVRVLEQCGFVRTVRSGRVRACFPMEHASKDRIALLDPTRRRIAEVLAADPEGLTQKVIAERAAVSRRLASHHLAHLRRHDMVETVGGRPARHRATPALRRELAEPAMPDGRGAGAREGLLETRLPEST